MKLSELLAQWRQAQIELRVQGDQLVVKAAKGAITTDIAATMRARKAEILSFLSQAATGAATSQPIVAVPRDGQLPLSSSQRRLWYLDQLSPGSSAYNMPLALELAGALDIPALRRALNVLMKRHEALRTCFGQDRDGNPVQVISAQLDLELPIVDLSTLSGSEREQRCDDLLTEWAREPFELTRAPLVRARLIALQSNAHVLFFMPHHVVYDGLSHEIFQRELSALYTAECSGVPAKLCPLPIQYADYAAWQDKHASGPSIEGDLTYWRKQLGGELPVLELPTRGVRPAEQTSSGATLELQLKATLVDALSELGRRHGATVFMVLLAGFEAVLARFTGQLDVVIGTPIANRPHQETSNLIGFFANTLALRTKLEGDPSFIEVLKRTRETCMGAYQHQDIPFDLIVNALKVPRDRSRTPVFQCMFSLDEQARAGTSHDGGPHQLQIVGHRPCGTGASRTDLTLWLRRGARGVEGTIEYNTDLFEGELMAQLARSYERILESALLTPDVSLSRLEIQGDADRRHLLFDLNRTEHAYPRERLLHQWFEAHAEKTPDRVALTCAGQSLTFAEVDRRANQLAHHLKTLSVGPDTVVGVCIARSLEMVIAQLAILKASGAYLPLDPGYPAERLKHMVEDSGARVVLVQPETRSMLPQGPTEVLVDAGAASFAHLSVERPACAAEPSSLAYVIYTSGSTGKSKGVMVEHHNTANFFVGMAELLATPGVWLNDTSISFDISVLELFGALGHGFHVVVRREIVDQSESVPALIATHNVTHFQCTPSQALMLTADGPGREALGKLTLLMVGGEALSASLATLLLREVKGKVVNVYGPTETTVWSSMHVVTSASDPMPIGRPIANTRLYVLDAHQKPTPKGVIGELWIGGAGVTRGYHAREELTKERFVPDPFADDGSRMYRTGDLVRHRPDGSLEYRGRTDFQVKLRGHRIELGEIESALRSAPHVRDAVVALREDTPGDQRLAAYVVLEGQVQLDSTALREHLRARLSEIMVPTQYMALPELPLTPNGKVDRRALPQPAAGVREAAEYVPPNTPLERAIAGVWQSLLKVERVGLHDNFFDLGGHSLLAVRFVRELNELHGTKASLGAIFAAPTVHALAAKLADGKGDAGGESFALKLRTDGHNLPLFCICGLHLYQALADALGPGQPVYGVFVPAEEQLLADGADPDDMPELDEIAEQYVKAIRTERAHGPYALAGVSFGGVLAFEVARQLREQGEDVRVLGLFDAILPRGLRRDAESWVRGQLKRLVEQGPVDLLRRLGAQPSLARNRADGEEEHDEDGRLEEIEALRERIYASAIQRFDAVAQPYPGSAVVFRARDQSALVGYEVDRHCGWDGLALAGLRVHDIDGDHLGILSEPNVQQLAAALRPYLDQASSSSPSNSSPDKAIEDSAAP